MKHWKIHDKFMKISNMEAVPWAPSRKTWWSKAVSDLMNQWRLEKIQRHLGLIEKLLVGCPGFKFKYVQSIKDDQKNIICLNHVFVSFSCDFHFNQFFI